MSIVKSSLIENIVDNSVTKEDEVQDTTEFTPPTENPEGQNVEGQGDEGQGADSHNVDNQGDDQHNDEGQGDDFDDFEVDDFPTQEKKNEEVALLIVLCLGFVGCYGLPLGYELINKKSIHLDAKQRDILDITGAKQKEFIKQVTKVVEYYDMDNSTNPMLPLMIMLAKHYVNGYQLIKTMDMQNATGVEKPKRQYNKKVKNV